MIKNTYPPNIDQIRKVLEVPDTMIFAFAPDIYVPSGRPLDAPLVVHETYHLKQQGDNPREWWDSYLFRPAFRASQEIPCFQLQYQKAKKIIKDRNKLNVYLLNLAEDLSGPLYGSIMTKSEAVAAIKKEKLFNFRV